MSTLFWANLLEIAISLSKNFSISNSLLFFHNVDQTFSVKALFNSHPQYTPLQNVCQYHIYVFETHFIFEMHFSFVFVIMIPDRSLGL